MQKTTDTQDRSALRIQLVKDQLKRAPWVLLAVDSITTWLLIKGNVAINDCLIWVAISTAIQFARTYVFKVFSETLSWTTLLFCFAAVGLTRTWPVWEVFYNGHSDKYMISVVILGMAAGGVGSVAGLLSAYLAWGIPAVGSLMIGWLSLGTNEGNWLAFMLTMMFTMLCLNVRSYGVALDNLHTQVNLANAERQRAENAVQARTRFFAAASHDLRQPLGVLRWYGDAIKIHATQLKHEALIKIGEGVAKAVERAEPLVRKYLEIARLDAGTQQLNPTVLPLIPTLRQVIEAFIPEAKESDLSLELSYDLATENELRIKVDQDAFQNVIDNLVGNALKFTPKGGVTLQAVMLKHQSPPMIRVAVSDTGIGIPSGEHERIFEDFYQLGNPQRTHNQGLGLGLAIVKRQAQLMGAAIGLDSELGAGTSIWLDFPTCTEEPATTKHLQPLPQEPTQYLPPSKKVLLIDDEEAIRQSLSVMLEALGWTVAVAANLQQAESLLSAGFKADAMIVDFRLEGHLNGPQVLQQLIKLGYQIPSLFLTGDTSPERLTELAQTGRPVLHKPINGERLVEAVLDTIKQEETV